METKQRRSSLGRAILRGVAYFFILAAPPALAQYTGTYRTNIISGENVNCGMSLTLAVLQWRGG
jgi:hypothetical protein